MAVEVTRYDVGSIEVLGADNDDTVAVADGAISTLAENGLYLIRATSDCVVRCKIGITDASDGRTFKSGEKEVRYLLAGVVVAVDAP